MMVPGWGEFEWGRSLWGSYGYRPPTTNWAASDQETYEDFNRQADNVEFVSAYVLPAIGYDPDKTSIAEQSTGPLTPVALFNNLESNLQNIKDCGLTMPSGWRAGGTFAGGQAAPDYDDANRWEENISVLYDNIERIIDSLRPAGTFAAGQAYLFPKGVGA